METTLEQLYDKILQFKGSQFAALRKVLGLTSEELAKLTRISRQTISALERGRRNISAATKLLIGVTLAELTLTDSDAMALMEIYVKQGGSDENRQKAHHRVPETHREPIFHSPSCDV